MAKRRKQQTKRTGRKLGATTGRLRMGQPLSGEEVDGIVAGLMDTAEGAVRPLAEVRTKIRVRTPSTAWRTGIGQLVHRFAADTRTLLPGEVDAWRKAEGSLIRELTEFCELERLDAVRIDREVRAQEISEGAVAALAEVGVQAQQAEQIAHLDTRMTALERAVAKALPLTLR